MEYPKADPAYAVFCQDARASFSAKRWSHIRGGRIHKSEQTFKIKTKRGHRRAGEKEKRHMSRSSQRHKRLRLHRSKKRMESRRPRPKSFRQSSSSSRLRSSTKNCRSRKNSSRSSHDRLLRTLAEYDNYRKRSHQGEGYHLPAGQGGHRRKVPADHRQFRARHANRVQRRGL